MGTREGGGGREQRGEFFVNKKREKNKKNKKNKNKKTKKQKNKHSLGAPSPAEDD